MLRKTEERTAIIRQFAACFVDHRKPELMEYPLEHLVGQRVRALALGYEDLDDHDDLRHDPSLAAVVGNLDLTGQSQLQRRDKGTALAGKSTLKGLELTPVGADQECRHKGITCHPRAVENLFVELFLHVHPTSPHRIILDHDATDDPIPGRSLGRFFHGYSNNYLPFLLYTCGTTNMLCVRLRPSDIDASAGALKQVQRIVTRIRQNRPHVQIILRVDSGFCRDSIMTWCDANSVDYLFRLARNPRSLTLITEGLEQTRPQYEATKAPAWSFEERTNQTRGHLEPCWSSRTIPPRGCTDAITAVAVR